MCGALGHVPFTRNGDRESGHRQTVMSTLPPTADMRSAPAHVYFGPEADIALIARPSRGRGVLHSRGHRARCSQASNFFAEELE